MAKINAAYQSWADYSAAVIIPARVRKPKDKAKAELSVLLVTRWILMRLRHHTFFSIGQLNVAIAQLLDSLNERPFQRLPGSRKSRFEGIEREAIKALPASPYEYVDILDARVLIDYHIEYKRHYYSVPHNLTKTTVEVHASAKLGTGKKKVEKASTFRSVQHKTAVIPDQSIGEDVIIHIGQQVRLQYSASVGIEAIMSLAREARS